VLDHSRISVREVTWHDATLPFIGTEKPLAVLSLDGKPVLQGSQPRVVLFGRELARCLADGEGRVEVVALRRDIPPMQDQAAPWDCAAPGVLEHAHHFGAPLVHVMRRGKIVLAKPKPLRVAAGDRLAFTFRNLSASTVRTDVVLILKFK